MDVKDAILSTRSSFKFKREPGPNGVIEQIFSYGTWAPNHIVTEQWGLLSLPNAFENM